MKRVILITWTILRLPLLALTAYLLRFQLLDLWERTIGLEHTVGYAVYLLSTASTRAVLYIGGVITLGIILWLSSRLGRTNAARYLNAALAIFITTAVSFSKLLIVPNVIIRSISITALFALNTLPSDWLDRLITTSKGLTPFMLGGVGVVEALTPQIYVHWLASQLKNNTARAKYSMLAGVLIVPFFWVFLLIPFDNQRIITLGAKLHPEPAVEKFADGDFNWIEFNPARRELYVVGLDTNFILAYNVDDLNVKPRKSKTPIDKTQSFAFNPERQEIYIYNNITHELLYFDLPDLKLIRSIPVPGMATGDVWIVWNRLTDSIIISSETDLSDGESFIMLDRGSGEILAHLPPPLIPRAFILFHPEKPVLYFNSFSDTYLVSWDMESYRIVKKIQTQPRTDRMAYYPIDNEVLVASTLEGAILRYDADTLEFKGKIDTSPGDRTLALDPKRNLLLIGNFIDNHVRVVDLTTRKIVQTFYLGPWIRTITLDTESGVAYISTIRGLFKLDYIDD